MAGARMKGARAGVAALEFALISPVLLTIILGTVEFTNAVRVQSKLNSAAGALANMIADEPSIIEGASQGQADETGVLADMCVGAGLNLLPFSATGLSANIASITNRAVSGVTTPVQDWESDTSCPTAASHAGAAAMLNLVNKPRSLLTQDGAPAVAGSSDLIVGYAAIAVKMTYHYQNILTDFLPVAIDMTAIAVARPRGNTTITCTVNTGGQPQTACPQNP